MTEKYQITIEKRALEEANVDVSKPLQLIVKDEQLTFQQKKEETTNQNVALRWFLLPTFVSTLIFFLYFNYLKPLNQIPLTGEISIASSVFYLGLLLGMITFTISFIKRKKYQTNSFAKEIYWRNFPTIVFSFLMILGMFLMIVFWVLGTVFDGASFDLYTATGLFSLFVAIVYYLMILFSIILSPRLMMDLLISVIVGGVGFSMFTNSHLQWWHKNFSFLGTQQAKNAWQFNLTLMVSALLMIALVDVLFVSLQKKYPQQKGLVILRILLTLTALNLGGVGFFPNNGLGRLHTLHNQSANFLVYDIIILIVTVRWLLPKVSKEFLGVSYGIAVLLVIINGLFQWWDYLSLTAFELLAFALAFSWILLLLQNLLRLLSDSKTVYEVELISYEGD